MKPQEPQWDKIEYTLMDVLHGAVGQLKAEYMKKMSLAESKAERNWWLAQISGSSQLTRLVDPTNAEQIKETLALIDEALQQLES